MAFYGKNVGVVPLTDAAGITKVFNWPSHKGLDIGWYAMNKCPVLAWQDGFVVDSGYGSEVGNYIVIEHTYSDGKRWTGYIHLADTPSLKKGDKVTLGKQMGNARRGNTGVSNGEHLHIYLTSIVPIKTLYSWNTMLEKSIDPKPYLYWSKEFNTKFISSAWTKELKKIVYPTPIARNIWAHQIEVKSDTRRLRQSASLSASAYDEYCTKGIYNAKELVKADGYTWALIDEIDGNKFWTAVMDGEDLPEKKLVYPTPVERDETINQIEIKSDTRKLRATPSLNGEVYDELCKRGIYNIIKWQTADGYDWALIAQLEGNDFWVAVMAGEDLPITDYQTLYNKEKEKNNILNETNKTLTNNLNELSKQIDSLQEENKKIKNVFEAIKIEKDALEESKAKAETELLKVQTTLNVYVSRLKEIAELAKI